MTTPTATVPAELNRVITLLLTNLGLSAVLAALFAIFHNTLLDHQMGRLAPAPGTDVDAVRTGLSVGLWSRVITVLVVAVVYVFLIRQLRAGKRRAFVRVLILSVASLAGIAYLALSGQYPWWVVIEQIVQALVLVALLWAVTRPVVRGHFTPVKPLR
ncbi:hypothetical protein [Pseudonocardia sp. GCM10023141]|uniref:hypothetical protein n=1 Tax=Pseudonocardia sp. GCM10023141 TaxID=3252653 RepID=UPI003605B7FD